MKVSKNSFENVNFSAKKEEIKAQQPEQNEQGGQEQLEKAMQCLASQVTVHRGNIPQNAAEQEPYELGIEEEEMSTMPTMPTELDFPNSPTVPLCSERLDN